MDHLGVRYSLVKKYKLTKLYIYILDKQTTELSDKVKDAQDMSISFSTVLHRANLAQNFHELAKEQAKICESLVHDQHLQQQGWAAVIANLDDLTNDFRRRSERYKKTYNEFIEDYDSYLTFLQR